MESGSTGMGSRSGKRKRAKRQKVKEDECILPKKEEENECIINNLPESMISRILSSLPFEDAIRTSALSKQWICRWTSMAKLDLNDRMIYSPVTKKIAKGNFVNVVNKALLLTKCSSMESFTLNIVYKYNVYLVNTWISSILNRGVQNLRICSCGMFEFRFTPLTSHLLFHSVLLEGLVICMYRVTITVPTSSVHLGSLKLLKLSGIKFTLNTEELNLDLPVLQRIKIRDCTWLNAKVVTLNVPLLESISMEHYPESLSDNCSIKFSAPQLTEFTYIGFGCISQYIVLLDPSSAHNASTTIKFKHCEKDGDPESGLSASLFLKQFCEVKYLCFDGSKFLAPSNVDDILPLFGMLSHLELGKVTVEVLMRFLLNSPFLKTLGFKGISKFNKEFLSTAVMPECLASTLQSVEFVVNRGRKHELCLAKFLMENGLVLEEISFSIHYQRGKAKVIQKFKEKLFSFQKRFLINIKESPYD